MKRTRVRISFVLLIAVLFVGCGGGTDEMAVTEDDAGEDGFAAFNAAVQALSTAIEGSGANPDAADFGAKAQIRPGFKKTFAATGAGSCDRGTLPNPSGNFFTGSISAQNQGTCSVEADGDSSALSVLLSCSQFDDGEVGNGRALDGRMGFRASISGSEAELDIISEGMTVTRRDGRICPLSINLSMNVSLGDSATTGDVTGGCVTVCGRPFSLSGSELQAKRVILYQGLREELASILQRQDNVKRSVDPSKRDRAIEAIQSFANTIGIPIGNIQSDENGRLFARVLANQAGDVDTYFHYTPATEAFPLAGELVVARKTWSQEQGAADALSEEAIRRIADRVRTDFGIPVTDGTDVANSAASTQLRRVEGTEDEQRSILRQTVGYFRKVGERQVANSAFQVDVDPVSQTAVGVSLRNWWGLGSEESASLKTRMEVKREIIGTFDKNGSTDEDILVQSCKPTYYQLSTILVPSITCTGVLKHDDVILSSDPIVATISLTKEYELDERDMRAVATFVGGDAAPMSLDLTDGNRFGVYYTTDETKFYYGADSFRDKFQNKWPDYDGPRWAFYNYFVGTYNVNYADNVDLLYVISHGAVRAFTGEDNKIWFNSSSDPVAQLGMADLEYLIHAGCHLGGAIYCEGMKATKRYTDSSSRDSVFSGLHILSGNHGVGISDTTIHKNKARTYAQYLIDGLTLIEAWDSAELDTNEWNNNYEDGCYTITAPDTGCGMSGTGFTCDRWDSYPASFYIKGKQNVTIDNRADYASDPRYGDADYDVDLTYRYQSETVPISATGYSLP